MYYLDLQAKMSAISMALFFWPHLPLCIVFKLQLLLILLIIFYTNYYFYTFIFVFFSFMNCCYKKGRDFTHEVVYGRKKTNDYFSSNAYLMSDYRWAKIFWVIILGWMYLHRLRAFRSKYAQFETLGRHLKRTWLGFCW